MTSDGLPLGFWDCRAVLSVAADDADRARKAIGRRTSDAAPLLARHGIDDDAVAERLRVDRAAVRRLLDEPVAPPAIMLDAEDAIAASPDGRRSEAALAAAAERLAEPGWSPATLRLVRLPATDAGWATSLLERAAACPPDAIVLPKAEDAAAIAAVRDAVVRTPGEVRLVLLVETPRGVEAVAELAAAAGERLAGVMFGAVDYAAGAVLPTTDEDHPLVAWARLAATNAAAAAGVPAVDGMTLAYPVAPPDAPPAVARAGLLDGLAVAHTRAKAAAAIGMSGKLVGHPLQLLVTLLAWEAAFDDAALDRWEASVRSFAGLTTRGTGVGLDGGAMVDGATDRLCRSLLRRAAAIGRFDTARAVELDVITPDEAERLGHHGSLP